MIYMPISEIFTSVNGEPPLEGVVATFVRLYGCNLRCVYCDTKYSYDTKDFVLFDEYKLKEELSISKARYGVITGGEPTMYSFFGNLLLMMRDMFDEVIVETNGSVKLHDWVLELDRVHWAVSPKLSNAKVKYKYAENDYPSNKTIFKFVISKIDDLREIEKYESYGYPIYVTVDWTMKDPLTLYVSLFDAIRTYYPKYRLYIQLHTLAHPGERGV